MPNLPNDPASASGPSAPAPAEEITLHRATPADLADIVTLNRVENDDQRMSVDYLRWWYFDNPSGSFSLFLSRVGGRACGMCSSNDAPFVINGRAQRAGFIQKVLTSNEVRGKGLFGKLYVRTDSDFLARGGDCFLAFPNAVAKPIYLAKYSYSHGVYPDLTLLFTNPAHLLPGTTRYEAVRALDAAFFARPILQFENAAVKSADFLRWRYLSFASPHYRYVALAVRDEALGQEKGELLGYVFLKKIRKQGLPVFVLMDVACHAAAALGPLLAQARRYAARQLSVGLLYLGNPLIDNATRGTARKVWPQQFDFLVKGRAQADTDALAGTTFNFFFGDLDFM